MTVKHLLFIPALMSPNFAVSESADTADNYETSNEVLTNKESDIQPTTLNPDKKETTIEPSKTPETFVPSEDISEDIAVSFPVDI